MMEEGGQLSGLDLSFHISFQIVATLASDLGDVSAKEARVLSFTATAPTVPASRIFIMHLLADGETDTNFSVGAFAQIPLQVVP